jgi:KDO2-lipid IV(A) lauroyltransferase
LRRRVRYPLEAVAASLVFGFFGLFTATTASALGGFLGRVLGPWLPPSRIADRNLRQFLPEKTRSERKAIIRGVWDNLFRVAAEMPHLDALWNEGTDGNVEVLGKEHWDALIASGRPAVIFTAHIGNWEILPVGARSYGKRVGVTYRQANNPIVNELINKQRQAFDTTLIPKGPDGARELVRFMKRGEWIALLLDQKMNDGIPVPFFGVPAMTAPGAVHLALRFKCPLLPTRVERLGGTRFRVTVYPPIMVPEGDRTQATYNAMVQINGLIEQWVRERPEQWFWVHNRWPAESGLVRGRTIGARAVRVPKSARAAAETKLRP